MGLAQSQPQVKTDIPTPTPTPPPEVHDDDSTVQQCLTILRESDDYGEAALDTAVAEGVVFTALSPNSVFSKWKRKGKPRGTPEWVTVKGGDTKRRILFLHGGGYSEYSPSDVYRPLTSKIALRSNMAVLAVDYRLVPEYRFPAPVEDAVKALSFIWENGPDGEGKADQVFVIGDSAGGGLALATVLAVAGNALQLAAPPKIPTAVVTVSAYTDLTCSLPSYQSRVWDEDDSTGDPIFTGKGGSPEEELEQSREGGRAYAGEEEEEGGDWRNPLASPVFAEERELARMPPTLLLVGDAEVCGKIISFFFLFFYRAKRIRSQWPFAHFLTFFFVVRKYKGEGVKQ